MVDIFTDYGFSCPNYPNVKAEREVCSKCEYVKQACGTFVQCRAGNQEERKKLVEKKPIVKICLTGGIGTGKSYLSKHFEDMGIPVYHSDDEAKKLYTDPDFLNELRDAKFAKKEMWNQDGTLNMNWLRGQFGNKEFFTKFSKFVHLWVHNNFDIWANRQNAPAVIMESAIVFEYHNESLFNKIIVADAPLWLRIKRVRERNPNLTESDIMERIAAQMPQEEKCKRADLVVCTGETYAIGNLWDNNKK